MSRPTCSLTITEGFNGKIHMVTKFEPPVPEGLSASELDDFIADHPTHEAIVAAAGAVGEHFKQKENQ